MSEKYLIQISILSTKEWEIRKSKGTFVMSIFKVDCWWLYFFRSLTRWDPKIEVCRKYFLDKNSKKQPLCLCPDSSYSITVSNSMFYFRSSSWFSWWYASARLELFPYGPTRNEKDQEGQSNTRFVHHNVTKSFIKSCVNFFMLHEWRA